MSRQKPASGLRNTLGDDALTAVATYTQRPTSDFTIHTLNPEHGLAYIAPYFINEEQYGYVYKQATRSVHPQSLLMGVDYAFEAFVARIEGRTDHVR